MPLIIKDAETERLAREVAQLTGESRTGAIRTALRECRARLAMEGARGDRAHSLLVWLESELWPSLPEGARGHGPNLAEQDALLGYDAAP